MRATHKPAASVIKPTTPTKGIGLAVEGRVLASVVVAFSVVVDGVVEDGVELGSVVWVCVEASVLCVVLVPDGWLPYCD